MSSKIFTHQNWKQMKPSPTFASTKKKLNLLKSIAKSYRHHEVVKVNWPKGHHKKQSSLKSLKPKPDIWPKKQLACVTMTQPPVSLHKRKISLNSPTYLTLSSAKMQSQKFESQLFTKWWQPAMSVRTMRIEDHPVCNTNAFNTAESLTIQTPTHFRTNSSRQKFESLGKQLPKSLFYQGSENQFSTKNSSPSSTSVDDEAIATSPIVHHRSSKSLTCVTQMLN